MGVWWAFLFPALVDIVLKKLVAFYLPFNARAVYTLFVLGHFVCALEKCELSLTVFIASQAKNN